MKNKTKEKLLFLFFVVIFITLLFWGNYRFVEAQPGGTDFLYRWLPTRLVFFEGYENPYSSEVEYQVELVHHGHAHQNDEPPGIFAYPYYTMGVFFPFALTNNFILARAAWMTLMESTQLGIIFLSLKIIKFKPAKPIIFALITFAILSADFAQALVDGNPSSLVGFFALLALYFILREKDDWAGVFLALSTIKPQLVILFIALVLLWAYSTRRWKIISTFTLCMLLLVGGSFVMQPSWFSEFFKDMRTYTVVARPSTPRAILSYWMPSFYANLIAWALSALSIVIIFYTLKFCLRKGFSALFWASSLFFILMPLTGITSAKSNYIAMLPAVVLLLWVSSEKLGINKYWLSFYLLLWSGLSWVFFLAGRNFVVNGRLIYFLDFYPLPLLLLTLYFFVKPFRKEKELTIGV